MLVVNMHRNNQMIIVLAYNLSPITVSLASPIAIITGEVYSVTYACVQ